MNNEPAAWINRHMNDGWLSWDKDSNADSSTPLYTHPADLTDEEIETIARKFWISEEVRDFAKALRKAQKK